MCKKTSKNINPFWIAQFISGSHDSIGVEISKEIIGAQVQTLINKNRLVNRLKVGVI